jgi:uncharacterized membrane protein
MLDDYCCCGYWLMICSVVRMHRSGNIQGSTTLWQERISIFLIMMMNMISNSYYSYYHALVSIRTLVVRTAVIAQQLPAIASKQDTTQSNNLHHHA